MKGSIEETEAEYQRLARELLRKAGEKEFTFIGREEATKLLASIEHVPMGQGSVNLIIPHEALKEAGVDVEAWKKEFRRSGHKGKLSVEVPAEVGNLGVLPVLNMLSKGVEKEMAEMRRRVTAVRQKADELLKTPAGVAIGEAEARALLDDVRLKRAKTKIPAYKVIVPVAALENAGVDVEGQWKPKGFAEVSHRGTAGIEVPEPLSMSLLHQMMETAQYSPEDKAAFSRKHASSLAPHGSKAER